MKASTPFIREYRHAAGLAVLDDYSKIHYFVVALDMIFCDSEKELVTWFIVQNFWNVLQTKAEVEGQVHSNMMVHVSRGLL